VGDDAFQQLTDSIKRINERLDAIEKARLATPHRRSGPPRNHPVLVILASRFDRDVEHSLIAGRSIMPFCLPQKICR
jgi:hypothetical protein